MNGCSSELRCLVRLVPVVLRAAPLFAQTPPATDIYLIALTWRDGRVRLGDGPAANITNWTGYDNQPFFLPDGRSLLYTSIREDGQADIYRYDLGSGLSVRLTATPESEYSPPRRRTAPPFRWFASKPTRRSASGSSISMAAIRGWSWKP